MCDIIFEKQKVMERQQIERVINQKQPSKKMWWKFSQNSQENICVGVSFIIKLDIIDLQLH